ncbi:MAG TPA: hypothetical protein VFC93_00555 [Chloroflexota bacterium]|nr:hypothetical protein [Chloroflexota bacterium]
MALPGLIDEEGSRRGMSVPLAGALSLVFGRLEHFQFTGSVRRSDGGAAALARAMLATRAEELLRPTTHPAPVGDYEALAGQFASYKDARRAIADLVARAAALPSGASVLAFYRNGGIPE